MATNQNADEPANDGDEQTTEQTETVEIELTPADVERIELEIDQSDGEYAAETVGEWVEKRVHLEFARIDHEADRHTATPEVEVPPLLAERARLEAESARQRGEDTTIEDILINNVEVRPDYRVDGYRVATDDE